MKQIFLLATILATFESFASRDLNLKCTAIHNLDKVLETEVILKPTDKDITFGEYEDFKFIISSKGENTIEVQSLNILEPSRSYATGKLTLPGSFVELSIWNRAYILDVRCTL
jgi:hypothetical protein